MTFKISAGIYPKEIVKGSGSAMAISGTIGAACFGSKKGPLGPHLITGGYEEFVQTYGSSDTSWSPAHLTLKPALNKMKIFYGNRVVNDGKYAGVSLFYDEQNDKFFSKGFSQGTSKDFESATRTCKMISFSDFLVSGDKVTIDLGSTAITQDFMNSSNYTLNKIANTIKSTLAEQGAGADCEVIKAWEMSDRKEQIELHFDHSFDVNDTVVFKISAVGVAEQAVEQSFYIDAETSMQRLANKINEIPGLVVVKFDEASMLISCLNAGPANLHISDVAGTFEVTSEVKQAGHGVYDDRVLLVTLPESMDDLEIGGSVTGSGVEVNVDSNSKVMDIFAENPGDWASNKQTGLGIKLKGLDAGTSQRTRLTMSYSIAEGQNFECTLGYNGESFNIGPIAFEETSDNTLKVIAQAIQEKMDEIIGAGAEVFAEEVAGGTENDRSILIIGPNPDVSFEINNALFTGLGDLPSCSVNEVIPNTPSNRQFTLEIYSRESMSNPLETYIGSLNKQIDAAGNSMQIEKCVNEGSNASANIRIRCYTEDYSKLQEINSIAWMNGGDDGYLPTNAQIVKAWDDFADPEQITVRLLMTAGYTNTNVAQKIATIAKTRRDAVALIGIPTSNQKPEGVVNYRKFEQNISTCYAACYAPDILVFDEDSGENVYVEPSGFAAAAICYTEQNWAIYWAAAGLTRGVCDGALGVRYKYNEAERDLVEGVHVNPVRAMGADGICIFGEYTAQMKIDPMTDLHVRLLANNIEIYEQDQFKYHLFDPNDSYSRAEMVKELTGYLKPIQEGRGISDFVVESDITKESPANVDMGCATIKCKIKPTGSLKYIEVINYYLGSAISFEEV